MNLDPDKFRCLTVQPPWSWAIAIGVKRVENRTWSVGYRGPIGIHAGKRWSDRGAHSPLIVDANLAILAGQGWTPLDRDKTRATMIEFGVPRPSPAKRTNAHVRTWGAVIAVAELVDVHPASPGCCESPWAETSYVDAKGVTRTDIYHWVLDDIRALDVALPATGSLQLWRPDDDLIDAIDAALTEAP